LLEKGNSLRQIQTSLKIGKSTVSRIRKEADLDHSLAKGGRPKLLSGTDKNYCVQQVTRKWVKNAVKVTKNLETDLGIKCNPETV
jgi:transposase